MDTKGTMKKQTLRSLRRIFDTGLTVVLHKVHKGDQLYYNTGTQESLIYAEKPQEVHSLPVVFCMNMSITALQSLLKAYHYYFSI